MRKQSCYITLVFLATMAVDSTGASAGSGLLIQAGVLSCGQAGKDGGQEITFDDLLKLVSMGIDEEAILKRLEKSPTVLMPSEAQVAELKKAGASDKLIAAMRAMRPLSAQAAELITDFAIVLDCSGSMKEKTPEGETKMEAAKRVVGDLVEKMPEGLNVTMVIYGHEVFGKADDPRNCTAVKVARELSPLDSAGKSELIGLIGKLRPVGATPIGLSLKMAGEELAKRKALSGLVLITDGLETCGGDPSAEAAALAAGKCTFGVHVVGFGTKPSEDAALREIADAGHGKYYRADSAKALGAALGGIRKALEVVAKPAEKKVARRRAIIVHQPPIKEFPALGEIQIVSHGLGSISVVGTGGYEEEIRVPSASVAYEIRWVPKDKTMLGVAMLKEQVFSERKVVEIRPEELLGLVRVAGEGKLKSGIVVSRPGNLGSVERATQCDRFGQVMVVPAGKWNVYVDDEMVEEGMEVEAGKLIELE